MKRRIQLTPRLQCAARMVPPCRQLYDIGTDHAYLPMYLVQQGVAQRAVACDVADGPVRIARTRIASYGMEQQVEVRKADGLAAAADADVAVLAGMGGTLIGEILLAQAEAAHRIPLLVLQPMTMVYELRRFLHAHDFEITDEDLAQEGAKFYSVLAVRAGKQAFESELQYHLGRALLEKRHPLLPAYAAWRAEVLKRRIAGLERAQQDGAQAQLAQWRLLQKQFLEVAHEQDL